MMAITITASLTNEQAFILANEKGYQETITTFTPTDGVNEMGMPNGETTTSLNTESPFEFLKRVYEAMVVADAQKHYLEYDKRLESEARRLADEKIKADVVASISSSVV